MQDLQQLDIFSVNAVSVSNNSKIDSKDYILENQKILNRYRMNCKNKGLTQESIKASCNVDIKLLLEFIDNKPLDDVKHTDIEDFLFYCQEERKNGDQAIARKFTSLNMFFRTLIVKEMIDIKINPLDKIDKPKVRKKYRGHLTWEEYQQILDYIDSKNNLRAGALYSLFFSSGCRLTEVFQLNRDSLDFTKRRFKVLGKGQKERLCTFSEDAKERILKYLDSRTDNLEPLFISRESNRWSKKSIQDNVKAMAKRAGIKKNVHVHLLRHTRAMFLLKQGIRLETIQKHLGHESIATTQVYARMDMDTVQNQIDEIDTL